MKRQPERQDATWPHKRQVLESVVAAFHTLDLEDRPTHTEKGMNVEATVTKSVFHHNRGDDAYWLDPSSQYKLALSLIAGDETQQDFLRAESLLRSAASQGHTDALFRLGSMLYRGEGISRNRTEALTIFRIAAAHGDTRSKAFLSL